MERQDGTGAADREFLGLEVTGDGTAALELSPGLARLDGKLYGGTAMAAAVTMAEHVTGRPALWATVQFVAASCTIGDRLELVAEVRAHGHRASQVRVSATVDGTLIFDALGATALAKEGAVSAGFGEMPRMQPPDAGPGWRPPMLTGDGPTGFLERTEIRVGRAQDPADQRYRLWARVPGRPVTAAMLGYLSDWVPSSVVQALGQQGGGISLDNTLRIGTLVPAEWVLVDFDPHLARGGYGHGAARLWSEDGVLLGVASQTSTLLTFPTSLTASA
ncbi:MAG: acyl-CoA thioesterase [Acidimicrobiia bacterium]